MNDAIFNQVRHAGVGMVIRDHEGRVTAAMSKLIFQPLGPLEIEGKATVERVLFAWEKYTRCVFQM